LALTGSQNQHYLLAVSKEYKHGGALDLGFDPAPC